MPDQPEVVRPVLRAGQVIADAAGQKCSGCGRAFGDGEQAVVTPRSWPQPRVTTLTCADCYRPPSGPPERFTDDGTARRGTGMVPH
jgi:hypothetical protein